MRGDVDAGHPLPLGEKSGVRGERAGVRGELIPPLPIGERIEVRGEIKGSLTWQRSHCQFETLSFRIRYAAPLDVLRVLFDDLAAGTYGAIARAKALIATDQGPYRFDLTFGKVDVARFPKDVADSRLVIIGEKLDGEKIRKVAIQL